MTTKINKPDIAVLIPCYNEELTIAKVAEDFHSTLPGALIYIYDNNSTDDTKAIAESLGYPIVRSCDIQGKGAVVRQMLFEIYADYYILVDGDATYGARDIREMLDTMINEDLDMIVGDRSESFEGEKWTHAFGNRLVDKMLQRKYKDKSIVDTMSGLRIFDNGIAKEFGPEIAHNGFEIETEMTIWCARHGKRLGSYPIDYAKRPEGSVSKLNTFRDGFRIIMLILRSKRK